MSKLLLEWLLAGAAIIIAFAVVAIVQLGKKNRQRKKLLGLQDRHYQRWKSEALASRKTQQEMNETQQEMQGVIYELMAHVVTEKINQTLDYAGVVHTENKVVVVFSTPSNQLRKAQIHGPYIRESLRLFNRKWGLAWLPTLDFEIREKEEGETNHGNGNKTVRYIHAVGSANPTST